MNKEDWKRAYADVVSLKKEEFWGRYNAKMRITREELEECCRRYNAVITLYDEGRCRRIKRYAEHVRRKRMH